MSIATVGLCRPSAVVVAPSTVACARPELARACGLPGGTCNGDADGSAGLRDLLAVLASWGPCVGSPADLDVDGDVGIADLVMALSSWGACR
jgi:hypothetical protein